ARTCGSGRSWARTPWRWTARPGRTSPSGRRTPSGSRSSGTSTGGTGARTRCAPGTGRGSGRAGSRAWARARSTSTTSSPGTATTRWTRRTRSGSCTRSRPARPAWSGTWATSGAMPSGWSAGPARAPRRAHVHLRGAPRLLDARAGEPVPALPGAGAQTRGLRDRDGLHPRGAAPGHGAPVLRVVGLPGHRLLRADPQVRRAPGLHVPDRPPAPARDRRDPGLGALPLPLRPARPRLLRRYRALRARGPAQGVPPGLEQPDLQLRPERG